MPPPPDPLWTKVRPVLDAVLDLDLDARLAYLDQACANRPRVRAEVEALLALEDEAAPLDGSVADLVRPLLEALDAPAADPLVQTRVGSYRIQARVGRGGMGTVYRAHRDDGLFESVVALKVVRRGLDTEDVLARFASERRILGRLAHPAIARLLDGGALDDGRPWLAMEFVEGVPLSEWAETRALSVRDRVALVLQVVRSVAFAHQRLVVHRDLKPSNVLVREGPDGEAQVKLLDFGIARVLEGDEDAAHTRTGRVGAHTPAYSAPEQHDGRPVTTATDVYQLGLLLTEVLTGVRAPLGETPAPSTLASTPETARAIRGDLDTLVAVACAEEPDARYPTAAALASDLERFLDGHALAARPPGRWERVVKFVRRHPAGVAAGAAITALVVLASGLAVAFAVITARQSAEVATQRDRAEATVEFMSGLFQEANPYAGRGESVTAGEMLRLGEERLRSSLAEEPVARAALLHTLGSIQADLRQLDAASSLLREAMELRSLHLGPDHTDTMESLLALIRVLRLEEDPQRSSEIDSLVTIAMRRTAPLQSSHPDLYAAALMNAGWQRFHEDAAGGERLMREHLDLLLRAHPPEAFELANGRYILGRYLHETGQFDEAMEVLRAAMPVFVAHYGPDHLWTGGFLSDLAVTCRLAPSCDDAEAFARRALEIRQARLPPDHRNWRTTRHIMGLVLFSNSDYEAAATWFQRALGSTGGERSLSSRYMLSYALLRDGRAAEAEPHAMEVLRRLGTAQAPEREFVQVGTRRVLAQIHARLGRQGEALDLLDAADAFLDRTETRRDWRPDQRVARAVVLADGGRHDEAMALVRDLPDDPGLRLDALLVRAAGQKASGQDPSATLRDAQHTVGDRPARGARARIAALRR